jgi:hypothetical protein
MKKYKILGILDDGGSKYHRIYLALKDLQDKIIQINSEKYKIEVTFLKQDTDSLIITEEVASNYNMIYYNWLLTTTDIDLSKIKNKYKIKLVTDIDDIWNDRTHPYFNPNWEHFVVRNIILADYVVVTNQYLAAKVFEYNNRVAIIPNLLPLTGQFVGKPEDKKFNGKLRIGLYGSFSHYHDFMLFKPILNRLAKNKNIAENCEFVLAGVNIPVVTKFFQAKKNIKYTILPSKNADSYMELLDDVDVVCQPLVNNPHNYAKSALKIIESSVKDCIFLGSELYEGKEFTSYFKCITPIDYEKTIEMLLEEGNYVKYLEETKTNNLADNKYEERVEFTRNLIELVSTKEDKKLEDVKIYSLKYEESQVGEFEEVLNINTTTGWRLEYQVFLDKLEEIKNGKEDYYSLLSWKFPYKTGIFKNLLFKLMEQGQYKDFDYINLCPKYWKNTEDFIKFSYEKHPKLEELLKKVLVNLNQPFEHSSTYTYSNFFVMKKEFMVDYIENWIVPSIEYMENEIWDEVNVDANYPEGLTKEKLKELTGMEFYNYLSFTLERLCSFYIQSKNLKVLNLL